MNKETRSFASKLDADKEGRTVIGYAAMFGKESNQMRSSYGMFVEVIERSAFDEALQRSDIRVLLNHDPNHILARTKSGTATVKIDSEGLNYSFTMPESRNDLLESIQRGDISQNSFAFTIAKGGEKWEEREDGTLLRTITKIDQVYDVSIVTYPAYEQSEIIGIRSLDEFKQANKKETRPYNHLARLKSIENNLLNNK